MLRLRPHQKDTLMDQLEDHIPADQVRTLYFGPAWSYRMLENSRRVPTPLGDACYLCEEAIIENDRGLIKAVALLGDDNQPYAQTKPVHAECDAYPIIGHAVGVCPCTGHPDTRNSALLAWQRGRLGGFNH